MSPERKLSISKSEAATNNSEQVRTLEQVRDEIVENMAVIKQVTGILLIQSTGWKDRKDENEKLKESYEEKLDKLKLEEEQILAASGVDLTPTEGDNVEGELLENLSPVDTLKRLLINQFSVDLEAVTFLDLLDKTEFNFSIRFVEDEFHLDYDRQKILYIEVSPVDDGLYEFMTLEEKEFLSGFGMYQTAKEIEKQITELLRQCFKLKLYDLIDNDKWLEQVNTVGSSQLSTMSELFSKMPSDYDHKGIGLMKISVKADLFDGFRQNLGEFIKKVQDKRGPFGVLFGGGHARSADWTEGKVKLKELKTLLENLTKLRNLILELDNIKNNYATSDQELTKFQDTPLGKFIEKYKGLKEIQELVNGHKFKYRGRKATKVLEQILHPSQSNTILNRQALDQTNLEPKEITTAQLIDLLVLTLSDESSD